MTAMARRRLLVLEFNELCPSLLDRWMAEGLLPNFKRFHAASEVFVSVADASAPALEPWIQWYSMHTGLSFDEHGVFRLTDGPRAGHADVWGMLRAAGFTTANVCGMNAKGFSAEGSLFLPDPWCTTEPPSPPELARFHRFVARMVQEYSNRDKAIAFGDASDFLMFMAGHGLRAETVADIARLLIEERRTGGATRWKRPFVLDWLQRDLFLHYFRRLRPDFSTFFLNSTAHLQHTYWRHMEPERFTVKPDRASVERYGQAILGGYRNMDRLIGDFLKLERDGVTLVFATALSQQPFLKFEDIGGQHFYRPRDAAGLLKAIGISPDELLPVMTHQFMARFATPERARDAAARLAALRYDGAEALQVDLKPDNAVFFGCSLRRRIEEGARLSWSYEGSTAELPLFDFFYMIEEVKSGMHHPDGCLWFKTGRHAVHPDKVSILDVLPTVLDFFGVDPRTIPQVRGRVLPVWGERTETVAAPLAA
jgi:hypothetical protein